MKKQTSFRQSNLFQL